jgi:hypothetical protein
VLNHEPGMSGAWRTTFDEWVKAPGFADLPEGLESLKKKNMAAEIDGMIGLISHPIIEAANTAAIASLKPN